MATDVGEIRLHFDSNASQIANDLNEVAKASRKVVKAFKGTKTSAEELKGEYDGVSKSGDGASESMDGAGESAKKSGNKAKESESFWSKLGRSLKRIFLYRTIRKVLSEIGQGAKEGLTNLYQWSSVVGSLDVSNTKSNLDALSSSALYLKNSLGAILGQAIQLVTPLLINMGNAVGYVLRMISALISALGGGSSYVFAKPDAFKQWGTDIGGATSKAKELRRILLGFDEVNRLDMETPSGGGGGAGSGTDFSDMFDTAEVPTKIKNIAETIKKLVPLVAAVGTAFGLWRVHEKLSPTLEKLPKLLGKINPSAIGVASAIGFISAAFIDAYQNNEDFRNGVDLAFAVIKRLAKDLSVVLGDLGKAIADLIPEPIKQKLMDDWKEITDSWGTYALKRLPLLKDIVGVFEKMGSAFKGSGITIREVISNIESGFYSLEDVVLGIAGVLGNAIYNQLVEPLRNAASFIDKIAGTNISSLIPTSIKVFDEGKSKLTKTSTTTKKVTKHASGGFPTTGQLFIARESGAELVGQIGGRTAVANNDQIVSAIEQGVYRAMSQANGNQNIQLNVDGKSLFDIIVARNNSVVRSTSKSPLLV